MKLYICWGTFQTIRPGGHPCHNAYQALKMAGHDPEVVKVRGLGVGPRFMHLVTEGVRRSRSCPGSEPCPSWSPIEGEVISDSHRIVDWAEANPAHRTSAPS